MNPTSPTGRIVAAILLVGLLLTGIALFVAAMRQAGPGKAAGTPTPTAPSNNSTSAPAIRPADAAAIDAILNSANEYLKTEQAEKADAILAAAVLQHPGEQRLYILHAEALATLKRLDAAYDAYVRALAIGPRDGETEFAAGTLASMIGKLDRAAEHYQAAQTAMKNDPRPPLYLAQVQLKLHQAEEAKASLAIAGKLDPESAIVWGTLAQVALDENRPNLAQQHAAKARELEPRVTMWRLLEARALRRQNKPEEALAILTPLDDIEKREKPVLSLLGECFGLLNRPADAAAAYAKAAEFDPSDGQLSLDTALWFERAGDKTTALKYAERAAMLSTDGAAAMVERLKQ